MAMVFGPKEICLFGTCCKYHSNGSPCYGTLERDREFFCHFLDTKSGIGFEEIPSTPEIEIKGKVILHG